MDRDVDTTEEADQIKWRMRLNEREIGSTSMGGVWRVSSSLCLVQILVSISNIGGEEKTLTTWWVNSYNFWIPTSELSFCSAHEGTISSSGLIAKYYVSVVSDHHVKVMNHES